MKSRIINSLLKCILYHGYDLLQMATDIFILRVGSKPMIGITVLLILISLIIEYLAISFRFS